MTPTLDMTTTQKFPPLIALDEVARVFANFVHNQPRLGPAHVVTDITVKLDFLVDGLFVVLQVAFLRANVITFIAGKF